MKQKEVFLKFCKLIGLFRLSSFLYRKKLNILCYHGFSYDDEHEFRPSLFMRVSVLKNRLDWLFSQGFHVVTLEHGLRMLEEGVIASSKVVVITIDDGFRSVLELAAPEFKHYDYPTTLYITSYYSSKETPIFRLVMQYIFWKSTVSPDVLVNLLYEIPPTDVVDNGEGSGPLWLIIGYGEEQLDESGRLELSKRVADLMEVDYQDIVESGKMSLVNSSQIPRLGKFGMDVQLHTHRHKFPEQFDAARAEIIENREYLEPLVGKDLAHFCYPSGHWKIDQWIVLEELLIRSATTCDPGMNDSSTSKLGLMRFLDRDDLTQIEFESELMGFKQLIRDCRNLFQH